MVTKFVPAPTTAPPMDDVDRWIQAQEAEAERLYRLYPEAFEGLNVPASWRRREEAERAAQEGK